MVVGLAGNGNTWNAHGLSMQCIGSENDLTFWGWLKDPGHWEQVSFYMVIHGLALRKWNWEVTAVP